MKLIYLVKGRLSVPYQEILIGINADRTDRKFINKMRWAGFHFDREHIDPANISDTVVDDLCPFRVTSHTHAPVSKDTALEMF